MLLVIRLVIILQIIQIAQVSPRGGAASGDPPLPRPIHPPFMQNFIFISIDPPDARLQNDPRSLHNRATEGVFL